MTKTTDFQQFKKARYMQHLISQIWDTLKINVPLSSETKLRVKELFLLLLLLQAESKEICIIDKLEEVNNLNEQEQLINWFYNNFVNQYQFICESQVLDNKTILTETSTEILALVERYQTTASPLQWTNFGTQIYLERYLSQKIDSLYQIGILVDILAPDETFDSYTRVTQETQNVCDRVCRWVKDNLKVTIDYLNIYEPFIYNYKKFTWQRSDALKEIGVRAGLLLEEVLESEEEISEINAKAVIDWLDDNYGIELISSEKYHPKFVNNLTINYRQLFAKTALLVVPIFLLLPIGILLYDHFYEQPSPNLSEILLERKLEVEKPLPLKPAR